MKKMIWNWNPKICNGLNRMMLDRKYFMKAKRYSLHFLSTFISNHHKSALKISLRLLSEGAIRLYIFSLQLALHSHADSNSASKDNFIKGIELRKSTLAAFVAMLMQSASSDSCWFNFAGRRNFDSWKWRFSSLERRVECSLQLTKVFLF